MKRIITLALFGALTLAPATITTAQEEPSKHEHESDEHTELADTMETMGRALRRLGRSVDDPGKNAESLKLVAEIRAGAEASLKLKPALLAETPASEHERFISEYQAGIKKLIATIDQLAEALKEGRNDEAGKLLAQLKEIQREGHNKFRKEED